MAACWPVVVMMVPSTSGSLERGKHLRTLRRDRPYERLDISGVKGLTDAQRATLLALGAIEKATTSR